jgi:intracellular sulfur oxidation DsrE/DsrF family protein
MNNPISRPGFARLITTAAALFAAAVPALPAAAAIKEHRIALHVDQNDPAVMNLALNNIANLSTYYSGIGDDAQIELVAYGPGLNMLREDTSPVKARITSIKQSIPGVIFSACNNTKTSMEKAEGHPIAIVPEAHLVPAGVVRLAELQELQWSYIKP